MNKRRWAIVFACIVVFFWIVDPVRTALVMLGVFVLVKQYWPYVLIIAVAIWYRRRHRRR